jgi:hypothetical protein
MAVFTERQGHGSSTLEIFLFRIRAGDLILTEVFCGLLHYLQMQLQYLKQPFSVFFTSSQFIYQSFCRVLIHPVPLQRC